MSKFLKVEGLPHHSKHEKEQSVIRPFHIAVDAIVIIWDERVYQLLTDEETYDENIPDHVRNKFTQLAPFECVVNRGATDDNDADSIE